MPGAFCLPGCILYWVSKKWAFTPPPLPPLALNRRWNKVVSRADAASAASVSLSQFQSLST